MKGLPEMNAHVTREQIIRARRSDLYAFLLAKHEGDVIREGRSYLRMKSHSSIVIKKGRPAYVRYSDSNETGNPVDLLTRYLGYTFIQAVEALAPPVSNADSIPLIEPRPSLHMEDGVAFPPRSGSPFRRVYAYLTQTRGLSGKTVRSLIDAGLLYQESVNNNAVFINREQTYCEVRGTFSQIKYHRTYRKPGTGPLFWYFKAGRGSIGIIYICEGAIDAVSLYELHCMSEAPRIPSLYCSVGGVSNQKTITDIAVRSGRRTILAVDNDPAGASCRMSNSWMEVEIPSGKDWNDDLLAIRDRRRYPPSY